MDKYNDLVGGFEGKKVAVLGLAFKPNTNDTRVAPALKVIPYLIEKGAEVVATDPQAIEEIKPLLTSTVSYVDSPYLAAEGADVLMLLIEWDEYKTLDLHKLGSCMKGDKFFVDTRNQYDQDAVLAAGLKYQGIGR